VNAILSRSAVDNSLPPFFARVAMISARIRSCDSGCFAISQRYQVKLFAVESCPAKRRVLGTTTCHCAVTLCRPHVAYLIWSLTSLYVSLVFGSSDAFARNSTLIMSFPSPLIILSSIISRENLRMNLVYPRNRRYSRVGIYWTRLRIGSGI